MRFATCGSWNLTTASTSARCPNGGSGKSSNQPRAWLLTSVRNASKACVSFVLNALTNGNTMPGTTGDSANTGE